MHSQNPTKDEQKVVSGVIFPVLGLEGVGKSNFINKAAGEAVADVSDELEHRDTTIRAFFLRNPATEDPDDPKSTLIVLVDTPGLDDFYAYTDLTWLKNLLDWITTHCSTDAKFGGILYLHSIDQDKCSKRSCPVAEFPNCRSVEYLRLATTKWDRQSPEQDFERREEELKSTVWKGSLEKGAKATRFLNTQESAWAILDELLETGSLPIAVLQQDLSNFLDSWSKKVATAKKAKGPGGGRVKRFFGRVGSCFGS
ncbi:hypothetical protein H1R20_g1950, partial [Candolleomyces eurysporus]